MIKPNCLDLPFIAFVWFLPASLQPQLPHFLSVPVISCTDAVQSGGSDSLSKGGRIQLCSLCTVQLQSSSGLNPCFSLTCLLILQGYSGCCQLSPYFPFPSQGSPTFPAIGSSRPNPISSFRGPEPITFLSCHPWFRDSPRLKEVVVRV